MSHHKAFRVLQNRLDCGWAQSGSVCRKDRIDRRVLLNLLPYGLLDIKLFNNGFDNEIRVGDTIFIVGVCRNESTSSTVSSARSNPAWANSSASARICSMPRLRSSSLQSTNFTGYPATANCNAVACPMVPEPILATVRMDSKVFGSMVCTVASVIATSQSSYGASMLPLRASLVANLGII